MVVVIVVFGLCWLLILIVVICGVIVMVLVGCFGCKDVYEGMDWKIIILFGVILLLGVVIEKSGLFNVVVYMGMVVVGSYGLLVVLLMIYLLIVLFIELMGYNFLVVLMVGIVVLVV